MPSSPASEGDGRALEERRPPDVDLPAPGRDLEAELAEMENRWKRALADLENYRKRSAGEIDRRVAERQDVLLRDWFEALDSVERALRMSSGPDDPVALGLQAVLDQMEGLLARHGIQRTGAVGEPFDPEQHDAVGVHATPDAPDRSVLDVARSGFAQGERVLRPAQVIVARRPEGET